MPDFQALLIADLHLEKGTSLAKRGVHLPPYDTRESLRQLSAAIQTTSPGRLIFLGDSFHDGGARERIDPDDLAALRAITSDTETYGSPEIMIHILQLILEARLPASCLGASRAPA